MSQQRYEVYSGMDANLEDKIATLIFEDGKLVDTEQDAPEDWGKAFYYDIAHHLTPEEFAKGHTSMVMIPEGAKRG